MTLASILIFLTGHIYLFICLYASRILADLLILLPLKALLPTVLFAAFVPQLVTLWQSIAIRLARWENHTYESAYDRSLTIKMFMVSVLGIPFLWFDT